MKEELQRFIDEEQCFQFQTFHYIAAHEIAEKIVSKALEKGVQICLEIFCFNKVLVTYSMDEMTPDNNNWLIRKRNAVLHFAHSTNFLYVKNNGNADNLINKYGLERKDYCIVPGGYPIVMKNGGVIGAISVSGLQDTQDHDLIVEVLREYFPKNNENWI